MVRHVLTLKYLAGMFDHPYTDPRRVKTAELTPANLSWSRTSAERSMVLLKNDNDALPLNTNVSSVAVVGPLANNPSDQLGPDQPIGYDVTQGQVVTVVTGSRRRSRARTSPTRRGATRLHLRRRGSPTRSTPQAARTSPSSCSASRRRTRARRRHEVTSRLPGQQQALVDAIAKTGKPYVVVLMNGRPLTLGSLPDTAPALLEAWYPGTEGGDAVADVLFGKVDPGGKLPMSFPRTVGQIPISYNELPTGRPADPNNKYTSKYLDVDNSPQYAFGYGLSYTTFSLSGLHLSSGSVPRGGSVRASATITNTGSVAGDDVVQLYIHESDTSILQSVRKLEGFQRVTLAPGQSRTVSFALNPSNFGFYNNGGQFVVEPGPVDVWVGDSSTSGLNGMFTIM